MSITTRASGQHTDIVEVTATGGVLWTIAKVLDQRLVGRFLVAAQQVPTGDTYLDNLVTAVLTDPAALWAVLHADIKIAGPWITTGTGRMRLRPSGSHAAYVYASNPLHEPDPDDFDDRYDCETGELEYSAESQYEQAMLAYKAEQARWKLWTADTDHARQYADNMLDACVLADQELRASGYMLVD